MNEKLYREVYELLSSCPKIDIHTHLTANRLMARGLDDSIGGFSFWLCLRRPWRRHDLPQNKYMGNNQVEQGESGAYLDSWASHEHLLGCCVLGAECYSTRPALHLGGAS